jgi:BolA family transcriptional regulator, general stress-responsive regulator
MKDGCRMTYAERIRSRLEATFRPEHLEVIDESAQHEGHSGARPGGETHFRVRMRAASLAGMNRVAQQRAVYAALKAEMDERVHALALELTV